MKTILIVEDDPSILMSIHEVAERSGYAVLDAATAEEAFEQFELCDAAVDLLIAGVTCAGSSGVRVALELRALVPYLKIIIASGNPPAMWDGQDAAELDELASDSVAVLPKPVQPATLMDMIHRFIGLPSAVAPALKMAS